MSNFIRPTVRQLDIENSPPCWNGDFYEREKERIWKKKKKGYMWFYKRRKKARILLKENNITIWKRKKISWKEKSNNYDIIWENLKVN